MIPSLDLGLVSLWTSGSASLAVFLRNCTFHLSSTRSGPQAPRALRALLTWGQPHCLLSVAPRGGPSRLLPGSSSSSLDLPGMHIRDSRASKAPGDGHPHSYSLPNLCPSCCGLKAKTLSVKCCRPTPLPEPPGPCCPQSQKPLLRSLGLWFFTGQLTDVLVPSIPKPTTSLIHNPHPFL